MLSDHVSCKKCGGDINFTEWSVRGLGFKLVVNCGKCDQVVIYSCPLIHNAYEINRRFIFAMRPTGVGLAGAERFCTFVDLPRLMFHSFYDRVVKQIRGSKNLLWYGSKQSCKRESGRNFTTKFKSFPGISVSGDGI